MANNSSLPPDAVPIGKIATRRMTSEELEAVKIAEAPPPPPPPPKPHELKVATRMLQTRRLTEERFKKVIAFATQRGISEADALVQLGLGSEDEAIATEAELTSSRWLSAEHLSLCSIAPEILALVPQTMCLELKVCPLGRDADGALVVAMRDPCSAASLEQLRGVTHGLPVSAARAGAKALEALIARVYASSEDVSSWIER